MRRASHRLRLQSMQANVKLVTGALRHAPPSSCNCVLPQHEEQLTKSCRTSVLIRHVPILTPSYTRLEQFNDVAWCFLFHRRMRLRHATAVAQFVGLRGRGSSRLERVRLQACMLQRVLLMVLTCRPADSGLSCLWYI
jgi:hypothetical protein